MLKMALLDCSINEKLVKVLMEDRALALFFRSHPGGFDSSSRVSAPGSLPSKAKKIQFTILKVEARSQNIKLTSLMHKGMQVHGALSPKGQ